MSLIKSISGIRGTIGGRSGEGLGGVDIVKFTAAYAEIIKRANNNRPGKIVVGRDARPKGAIPPSYIDSSGFGIIFSSSIMLMRPRPLHFRQAP